MTDKQPMQADGGGKHKPDPTSADGIAPGKDSAGESGGGAYPNPHTGKERGEFDGGQSEQAYSGPDNPNATTK